MVATRNDCPRSYDASKVKELGKFWRRYGKVIMKYGRIPVSPESTGVGGNTYRAYGSFVDKEKKTTGAKQKGWTPSRIFQSWVNGKFKNLKLRHTNNFEKLHNAARESLVTYWRLRARKAKKVLPCFPYASKLIDLHFKHLIWHPIVIGKGRREKLSKAVYQPLDKYSLICLKKFNVTLKIDKNPKMGSVKSEKQYLHLQEEIRCICKAARVPLFAFDQFAWNYRGQGNDG